MRLLARHGPDRRGRPSGWLTILVGHGGHHLMLCLNPFSWRLDLIDVVGKPGYRRLYLGPLEVEWS